MPDDDSMLGQNEVDLLLNRVEERISLLQQLGDERERAAVLEGERRSAILEARISKLQSAVVELLLRYYPWDGETSIEEATIKVTPRLGPEFRDRHV